MSDETKDVHVVVHGSWNGWRSAEIRLADLEDVHWSQPAGAPHPLIHGFVQCTNLPHGSVLEDECAGAGSYRVCVLRHHVVPSTYAELVRRAGARAAAAPAINHDRSDAARTASW